MKPENKMHKKIAYIFKNHPPLKLDEAKGIV